MSWFIGLYFLVQTNVAFFPKVGISWILFNFISLIFAATKKVRQKDRYAMTGLGKYISSVSLQYVRPFETGDCTKLLLSNTSDLSSRSPLPIFLRRTRMNQIVISCLILCTTASSCSSHLSIAHLFYRSSGSCRGTGLWLWWSPRFRRRRHRRW